MSERPGTRDRPQEALNGSRPKERTQRRCGVWAGAGRSGLSRESQLLPRPQPGREEEGRITQTIPFPDCSVLPFGQHSKCQKARSLGRGAVLCGASELAGTQSRAEKDRGEI